MNVLRLSSLLSVLSIACIVYTWDYRSSASVWQGFRTQPMLGDEVQTFKALISVHKIIREGHPTVNDDKGRRTKKIRRFFMDSFCCCCCWSCVPLIDSHTMQQLSSLNYTPTRRWEMLKRKRIGWISALDRLTSMTTEVRSICFLNESTTEWSPRKIANRDRVFVLATKP